MRKLSPEQQVPFGNHVRDAGVRARVLRMAEAISKTSTEVIEALGPSSLDPVLLYLRHPPDLNEMGPWLLQRPLLQGVKPMEWRSLPPVQR